MIYLGSVEADATPEGNQGLGMCTWKDFWQRYLNIGYNHFAKSKALSLRNGNEKESSIPLCPKLPAHGEKPLGRCDSNGC